MSKKKNQQEKSGLVLIPGNHPNPPEPHEVDAVVGWIYYFRIAKMKTVLEEMDSKLRKRIRVIIWKQWKVFRKKYESLLKLGATHRNARRTAGCRKGYQYICNSATIHATITNKRLEARGLTSLSNLYAKVHLVIPAAI